MVKRVIPDRWLVAFSFAGEQRELVRSVAEKLEEALGESTVYFDEWYEFYLAGHDADRKLQAIYKNCALAIVCVSAPYEKKAWTLMENEAIRARVMQARIAEDPREQHGVLPIRVGEGDIDIVPINAIVKDIRQWSLAKTTRHILDRLELVAPDVGVKPLGEIDWPEELPTLAWPVANHTVARDAFSQLLRPAPPYRVLLIRGPSETGKSHISKQMLRNSMRVEGLVSGRFDFKGTTDMDGELRAFTACLDVETPPANLPLNERLSQVLDTLKRNQQPTLLIFDTYNNAGDAEEWVRRQLLPGIFKAKTIRVVITGQNVPGTTGELWEDYSAPLVSLKTPPAKDWYEYGKQYREDLTLEFVEQACSYTDRPTALAAMFGPKN